LTYRIPVILLIFISFPVVVSGQKDSVILKTDTAGNSVYLLQKVERDGVVLPEVNIKEVTVIGRKGQARKAFYRRYDRLTYNIRKVYPYAIIVRQKLAQVNEELASISDEKERKKYLKGVEELVLGEYEDDMREMTITQGKLLIKLIDRETQNTSYDLIKQYRGGLSAAFWQGIARLFGTNLRAEYDPYGEDAAIEAIVKDIETGIISYP
jgi:hypothetical protein